MLSGGSQVRPTRCILVSWSSCQSVVGFMPCGATTCDHFILTKFRHVLPNTNTTLFLLRPTLPISSLYASPPCPQKPSLLPTVPKTPRDLLRRQTVLLPHRACQLRLQSRHHQANRTRPYMTLSSSD